MALEGVGKIPITVPKSAGLSLVGTLNWCAPTPTPVCLSMYLTCAFEPPGTKMQVETGLQQTFPIIPTERKKRRDKNKIDECSDFPSAGLIP